MSSVDSNLIQNYPQQFDTAVLGNITQRRLFYYYIKSIFDFIAALILLIVLSPIMGVVALAIFIYSPGPILFIQKRVGAKLCRKSGTWYWQTTEFPCYKFRSMHCNADPSLHQAYIKAYINNNQHELDSIQGNDTKIRKLIADPRITGLGKILRKTSIDELPQLWNVLRGEMSLVGPRPAIPYEVELYQPWHLRRLLTKPGMTGLWQVMGRCLRDFDESILLDIEYIEKQSFWFDLKILLKTPIVVLTCKGAH